MRTYLPLLLLFVFKRLVCGDGDSLDDDIPNWRTDIEELPLEINRSSKEGLDSTKAIDNMTDEASLEKRRKLNWEWESSSRTATEKETRSAGDLLETAWSASVTTTTENLVAQVGTPAETLAETNEKTATASVEKRATTYNDWKKLATEVTAETIDVSIALSGALYPSITWYNENADEGACSIEEKALVNKKITQIMDGILAALGFTRVAWDLPGEDDGGRRQLRGAADIQEQTDRDLYSISSCTGCVGKSSFLCSYVCAYRMRRLAEARHGEFWWTSTGTRTTRIAEYLAEDTTSQMKKQCRHLLRLIAALPSEIQQSCRNGLRRAVCEVDNVSAKDIVGVVGPAGSFETAAAYIARSNHKGGNAEDDSLDGDAESDDDSND